MKAPITAAIGAAVAVLSAIQFAFEAAPVRLIGLAVGLFFLVFGWWVGWTRYRGFTIALGHFALTVGVFVIAFAAYQIPFLSDPPSPLEVLDLPLFWGLFTTLGGVCMIQHGTCACCIRRHEAKRSKAPRS